LTNPSDGAVGDGASDVADGASDVGVVPDAEPASPDAPADRTTPPDTRVPTLPFTAVEPCLTEGAYVEGSVVTATATFKYTPACLKVARGTAVKFVADFNMHPLEPSASRGNTTDNPITKTTTGTEATFTFAKPGVYAYFCGFHGSADNGKNMAGAIWVTETASPGDGSVTPSQHDFGPIAVGATSDTFTFTVSNPGGTALAGFSVDLTGADFVAPVAENKCAGLASLASGMSCSVGVQFKPASRGSKNGALTVRGGGQTVVAPLTGTGQTREAPVISPMSQSFAGQAGKPGTPVIFTVANIGDAATGVLGVTLGGANAGDFKITSNGCLAPLASGAYCQVGVAVNAATAGTKSATLTVASPGTGMAVATLTAYVVAGDQLSITPTSTDFTTVTLNATSAASAFQIRNSGGSATPALSVSVGTSDFIITANTCSGVSVPAGATCAVSVAFRPGSLGAKSTLLTVSAGSTSVIATLSGTGVGP
jgi:plastocyanin